MRYLFLLLAFVAVQWGWSYTRAPAGAVEVRLISPWYDGHLWITAPATHAWQPIHHPDCPCHTTVRLHDQP